MEIKDKKKTLAQNITYMALMAAINVIFVLLTTLVPVLFFLIVFVLPLTSTIVTLHCQKRYFPIYAFSTIALCLLCTIWKIDDTIFYVIPSIISGFVFGVLAGKKVPSFWIIVSTTVIQIAFTYASIPLIELMTGRNIIDDFSTVFGIKDFIYLDYVTPCFIYFLALAQEILAFVIIREELPKFGIALEEPKHVPLSLTISIGAGIILTVIFAFTYGPLAYLFTLITLFLSIYAVAYLIMEKKVIIYIFLGVATLLSFFLFAVFYPMVSAPLGLLFINILFFMIAIIVLINNYLLKSTKVATIK